MTLTESMLRTILENPHDDGPRLVAADWLEERGACDRAEFIRVQCELAELNRINSPKEGYVDIRIAHEQVKLSHRAAELLAENEAEWLRKELGEWPLHIGREFMWPEAFKFQWHRGWPSRVECRLADWCGGLCPKCVHESNVRRIRRCPTCHGTGRTPGLGAVLLRRAPIEQVVVTDRQPYYNDEGYSWWDAPFSPINAQHLLSDIPNEIWKKICGFRRVSELAKYFDSAYAARDALSAALIKLAREQMEPKEVANV